MKMDPKSNKIYAVEEITQKKKNIKLGNIYEENVGTQTQHFEGQEIGGPNKNQVVMYYSNKLFYIIPLEKSYTFKKQLSHVDSSVQEELLNFSNDPEYAQTNLKHRKKANAGTKAVEQHNEKVRAGLGVNTEDNREEILKDALRKRNEKINAKRNK
ncbi:unnamed protein product [Moneuplotes crassus]|uniref:Uncharacterized protein n=1 Tax=Euplotes crassus TaxID=5936 RepID=A0AAD1XG13_EUPCR|nr:unnamed protein product [Moneuplotes crassus]